MASAHWKKPPRPANDASRHSVWRPLSKCNTEYIPVDAESRRHVLECVDDDLQDAEQEARVFTTVPIHQQPHERPEHQTRPARAERLASTPGFFFRDRLRQRQEKLRRTHARDFFTQARNFLLRAATLEFSSGDAPLSAREAGEEERRDRDAVARVKRVHVGALVNVQKHTTQRARVGALGRWSLSLSLSISLTPPPHRATSCGFFFDGPAANRRA